MRVPEGDVDASDGLMHRPWRTPLQRKESRALRHQVIEAAWIIKQLSGQQRHEALLDDVLALAATPGGEVGPDLTDAAGASVRLDDSDEVVPRRKLAKWPAHRSGERVPNEDRPNRCNSGLTHAAIAGPPEA